MAKYLATVKLLIEAESEAEACDAVAEALRPAFVDWAWLSAGCPASHLTQGELSNTYFTSPVEVQVEEPYEEGDFLRLTGDAPQGIEVFQGQMAEGMKHLQKIVNDFTFPQGMDHQTLTKGFKTIADYVKQMSVSNLVPSKR